MRVTPTPAPSAPSARLVVKFHDTVELDAAREGALIPPEHRNEWYALAKEVPSLSARRLFQSVTVNELAQLIKIAQLGNREYRPPKFANFLSLRSPEKSARYVVERMSAWKAVELIYERPDDTDAGLNVSVNPIVLGLDSGGVTWDPTAKKRQAHLKPAPKGLGVTEIWKYAGADGAEQHFIDIERGWTVNHRELLRSAGAAPWVTLVLPPSTAGLTYQNVAESVGHGTAVMAIVCATHNNERSIGFAPQLGSATALGCWSQQDRLSSTADALLYAGHLRAVLEIAKRRLDNAGLGGVVLIETQTIASAQSSAEKDFYPVEIYPETFAVIELLTHAGITVVEPAGNGRKNNSGGIDLDQPIMIGGGSQRRTISLLPSATNPAFKDSGAIMVGGAEIQPGRHVWSRVPAFNFGQRVDCYAAGNNVVTAWSTQQGNQAPTTDQATSIFSGTSSASAIIAGAALSVRGIYWNNVQQPMPVATLRKAFTHPDWGTPVHDPSGNTKIGVMPNLVNVVNSLDPV